MIINYIILFIIGTSLINSLMIGFWTMDSSFEEALKNCLCPWTHKELEANLFGKILFTILTWIITMPWALIYWVFYKLCTVGKGK